MPNSQKNSKKYRQRAKNDSPTALTLERPLRFNNALPPGQKTVRDYAQAPSTKELLKTLENNKKHFDEQCALAQELFLMADPLDDDLFTTPEPDAAFGVRFRPAPGDGKAKKRATYFDSVLVQRVYGRETGEVLGVGAGE